MLEACGSELAIVFRLRENKCALDDGLGIEPQALRGPPGIRVQLRFRSFFIDPILKLKKKANGRETHISQRQ